MKVRFSPRAQRRVKIVAKWWRENRPAAPTLFDDELQAAIERLKRQPTLGLEHDIVDSKIVRRILLATSAQHVYYVVDEERGIIVIYTVWGARRERTPKL
ncbi:MAG TPA: type II toxin-antitoxin system RelE/ParE family toxin [Polyangiaceae bacterium]|nr:type II toxin-antitoxin system RelE/ParE family toxin [Polyangiaceae bacterium]